MSETGFRIFNRVFSIGAALLYAGLLTAFFRPFIPRGKRPRNLLLVFSVYLLFELACNRAALPQGAFGLILTAALMAVSRRIGVERALMFLLTLLYFNARISGGLMAESLYFILERLLPLPTEPLEAVFLRAAILLQLYERHPAFLAVVPVLALLFYAGAYLTIAFQQGMSALREEQAACFLERQQTQMIRARIHEAEQFYARIRGLKHEMRGHMTNIKVLASCGEYAGLKDYIARMDESISDFELTLQTGNPVTDVIVNDMRRQSLDLDIRFQADFHYRSPGAYDAFDVGIILQNLLQNAVEACGKVSEGERFIVLTGKRKGRFFLIEVRNSFSGEVVFGQDGLPVTTKKEDVSMHGIGLANVRREAEKYMGELELKTNQQIFSATVLLQEGSSL